MIQIGSMHWDISQLFSVFSTGKDLKHEQQLHLKNDGRQCRKIPLKDCSSESVCEMFPWICGNAVNNTYFCWPCHVMGILQKVRLSRFFRMII